MIMKKILLILFIFFLLTPFFRINAVETTSAPAKLIKILLVPGHDAEIWGAQYGNTKEANMNLAVASRIYDIFKKDKRFGVYITRDDLGYTKEFADYFTNQQKAILAFKENAKKEMKDNIFLGNFIKKINPPHLVVSQDMSIKLYGINKWADENNIDAVIHIHFNDYPRKNKWTIGKYAGFAIYIPEGQMVNSYDSGQLAANIFTELKKKYTTSTYGKELGGLIPDQTLIALGSNGTLLLSVRSVLIEYGYIYEKKFRNYNTRHQAYKDMAALTAQGIKNYFFGK